MLSVLEKPTGTSVARAVGFNRQNVIYFFTLLKKLLKEHSSPPERIFGKSLISTLNLKKKLMQSSSQNKIKEKNRQNDDNT